MVKKSTPRGPRKSKKPAGAAGARKQPAARTKTSAAEKKKKSNARRRADARQRQRTLRAFAQDKRVWLTGLAAALVLTFAISVHYAWNKAQESLAGLAEVSDTQVMPAPETTFPDSVAPEYHAEEPGLGLSLVVPSAPLDGAGQTLDSALIAELAPALTQDVAPQPAPTTELAGATTPLAWLRNAVTVPPVAPGAPRIAIVLDDLGLNYPGTQRAIALPAPLTLAFIAYAEHPDTWVAAARAQGHEILVHVPMEPMDMSSNNPGPNALLVDLDDSELRRRLGWGLDRFQGYVGINNHMGSRFSADDHAMRVVLEEVRARGLLFLDSVTNPQSVGLSLAEDMGIPSAKRDVFIDNTPEDAQSIRIQLERLEFLARRDGHAVGIGHPHEATLDALTWWIADASRRGFVFVPISAIVRERQEDLGLASSG